MRIAKWRCVQTAAVTLSIFGILGVAAPGFAAEPSSWPPASGFWTTPTIHGAGRIHFSPDFAYQPDPKATYKIVFGLTKMGKHPNEVSPSIEHVARAVNLYVKAGVPLDHLKFVAVAYGPGTAVVVDNAHYKAKFGVDNPNLPVIAQLRKAGVDVAVCAQAMAEHHFKYEWLDKDVTLALSGLTTVADLQLQGYAVLIF